MPSTRSTRRTLIAGLICVVVLAAVGLLLDQAGVRFPSTLIPALGAAAVTLVVILLVRRRG